MNRIIPSVLALLVVLLALPVQAEEDASPAAEEGSESESEESSDSESGDETKNKKEAEASAEDAAEAPAEEAAEAPAEEAAAAPAEEAAEAPAEEAAAAPAEACTYEDLQGKFTLTLDCAGLQDFSGIAQEQKRIWLSGPWGQFHIIEVPEPYRTESLDTVMSNLGRFWTAQRTIGAASSTTVAGADARVVTERKLRTTSRSWVFQIGGRNVIARAVSYGPRKQREESLETMSAAMLAGFELSSD